MSAIGVGFAPPALIFDFCARACNGARAFSSAERGLFPLAGDGGILRRAKPEPKSEQLSRA
jgi:hypothetical protein